MASARRAEKIFWWRAPDARIDGKLTQQPQRADERAPMISPTPRVERYDETFSYMLVLS
jgi:hypothetical protein